jgi:hypothetical protein
MNRVSPALSINQLHGEEDLMLKKMLETLPLGAVSKTGSISRSEVRLHPKSAIKGPILDRFAHVFGVDLVAQLQIGNGA